MPENVFSVKSRVLFLEDESSLYGSHWPHVKRLKTAFNVDTVISAKYALGLVLREEPPYNCIVLGDLYSRESLRFLNIVSSQGSHAGPEFAMRVRGCRDYRRTPIIQFGIISETDIDQYLRSIGKKHSPYSSVLDICLPSALFDAVKSALAGGLEQRCR